MAKADGLVSAEDLHAVRVLLIIILFWMAIWNLMEEFLTWVQEKTKMKRWKIYLILAASIFLVILFDPQTFENIL